MARWSNFDWILLGAGVAAAVAFFLLFENVMPYAIYAPNITQTTALASANRALETLWPETKPVDCTAGLLPFVALDFPAQTLTNGLDKVVSASRWSGSWSVSCKASSVLFDREGRVLGIWDRSNHVAGPPSTPTGLADATLLAEKRVEEAMGVRLHGISPLPYVHDAERKVWRLSGNSAPTFPGAVATPVFWRLPPTGGSYSETLEAVVVRDRITNVYRRALRPDWIWDNNYYVRNLSWTTTHNWAAGSLLLLGIVIIALTVFRGLYKKNVAFLWALSFTTALPVPLVWWKTVEKDAGAWALLACAAAIPVAMILFYGLFSLPFDYLFRTLPEKLKTFLELSGKSAALAATRGAFLGWLYAAFYLLALLVLEKLKWATTSVDLMRAASDPDLSTWAVEMVALPLSLVKRTALRTPLVLASIVVLWMAGGAALPGAAFYPTLPLYAACAIEGLFFAWTFLHYDLLTTWFAMFTVETWLVGYSFYRYYEVTEPWSHAAGIIPWFLLLAAALFSLFRPQLRRAAAIFG